MEDKKLVDSLNVISECLGAEISRIEYDVPPKTGRGSSALDAMTAYHVNISDPLTPKGSLQVECIKDKYMDEPIGVQGYKYTGHRELDIKIYDADKPMIIILGGKK